MINKYQRMAMRLIRGIEMDAWNESDLSNPEVLEAMENNYSGLIQFIAKLLKDEFGRGQKDLEIKKGE